MPNWRVLISIPPEMVEPLRAALPNVVTGERHALITEVRNEGVASETELWVDVDVTDSSEAAGAAASIVGEAAAIAGLPDVDGTALLGMWPPAFVESPWHVLRRQANDLLAARQYDFAVVRAQTSLELYLKAAVDEVCRRQFGGASPLVAKHLRSTLRDDRTLDLLEAMTGQRANDRAQLWWPAYKLHLQRRHAIVHEGVSVSEEQASESLAAVDACRGWMLAAWNPWT